VGVALSERALRRLERAGRSTTATDLSNRPAPPRFLEHLQTLGIEPRVISRSLRALSADVSPEQWRRLNEDPAVARVSPVRTYVREKEPESAVPDDGGSRVPGGEEKRANPPAPVELPEPSSLLDADYGPSFGQNNQIGARSLHARGYSGIGVLVCILDGGFAAGHEAFAGAHLVAAHDFVGQDSGVGYEPDDPGEPYNAPAMESHGTSTWSALGGFARGKLIGPAYRADFAVGRTEIHSVEIRVEEDNYVAGLEWADSLGADIVSTSLGYLNFDDGFAWPADSLNGHAAVTTKAAAWAARRGIVVATAAGNEGREGYSTLITPADAESILAVGAVDAEGARASFSSRGPTADGRIKPDICALGVNTACAVSTSSTTYGAASGTSLATPLIGGLAALLREAHPDWSVMEIIEALKSSGDQADTPDNDRGWGIPNGLAALGEATGVLDVTGISWKDAPQSPGLQNVASPGDSGEVNVILRNRGRSASPPGWVSLTDAPPRVLLPPDSMRVPLISPGGEYQLFRGLACRLDPDYPADQAVIFSLRIRPDEGLPYTVPLVLPVQPGPGPGQHAAGSDWISPSPLAGKGEQIVTFHLNRPSDQSLSIHLYGLQGRMVELIRQFAPGEIPQQWDWSVPTDLPTGVYWIRLASPARSEKIRFVRIH